LTFLRILLFLFVTSFNTFFSIVVEIVRLDDTFELESFAHDIFSTLVIVFITVLLLSSLLLLGSFFFVWWISPDLLLLVVIITIGIVIKFKLLAIFIQVLVFFANGVVDLVLLLDFLFDLLSNVSFVTHGDLLFFLHHSVGLVNVVQGDGHILVNE